MNKLLAIVTRAFDFLMAYLREILGLVVPNNDETAGE